VEQGFCPNGAGILTNLRGGVRILSEWDSDSDKFKEWSKDFVRMGRGF